MKRQVTAAMTVCLSATMAFSSLAAVKLETPTGVQWSDEHEALPQWNAVDGAAGQYQVEAYLDGERFYRSTHRFSTTNLRDTYEARGFICNVEDSGIYQFRVMALGDDINTTDSDWSPMSESWSFTKPSLQFGKPSNLRWEGTTLMWDEPEIPAEYEQYLNGYEVTVYGDGEFIIGHNSIDPGYDNAEWMEEDDVSQWTFSVRAISNTPSVIFHGETVEGDDVYDAGEENASISDTIDGILSSEDPEILENAPDKLKENTDKRLNIQMISYRFGYSPAWLQRIFKAETGKNIMQYFSLLKVERAKRMIADGEYTIGEISDALGYDTPQYFSRKFKSVTNMTPSAYAVSVKGTGVLL